MIIKQVFTALPSSIQFDSISIGDAITASSITITSTATASLLVVQNIASINHLTVTSTAQFSGASFSGGIQASDASFSRGVFASNIQVVTGSFSGNLVVTGSHSVAGVSQFSAGSFSAGLTVVGSYSVAGVSQFSAASFSGAITAAGSVNITGGMQASNASVNILVVAGSHSVAGVSQFSAASFSGEINAVGATFTIAVFTSGIDLTTGSNAKIYFSADKFLYEDVSDGEALKYRMNTGQGNPAFIIEDQNGITKIKLRSVTTAASFELQGSSTGQANFKFESGSTSGFVINDISANVDRIRTGIDGATRVYINSFPLASTAIASKTYAVNFSAGSVLTFTWTNSVGNMYRTALSGASV